MPVHSELKSQLTMNLPAALGREGGGGGGVGGEREGRGGGGGGRGSG